MEHVFVRIAEGDNFDIISTCLLSGDNALEFIENPNKFVAEFYDGARVLASWVVPGDLENATGSDSVMDAFEALLALDALAEFPVVSDLFATIFEAGYRLATNNK